MSTHVLLNELSELWKRDKCEATSLMNSLKHEHEC